MEVASVGRVAVGGRLMRLTLLVGTALLHTSLLSTYPDLLPF